MRSRAAVFRGPGRPLEVEGPRINRLAVTFEQRRDQREREMEPRQRVEGELADPEA